jgi:predicted dehydrogenase
VSYFADKPETYWHGGYSGRAFSNWRLSRTQSGGGTLIMNLCHYIDLVRYVGALEAQRVTAVVGTSDRGAEVEDTVSVSVQYTNGAVGSFFGTAVSRGLRNLSDLRIWGSDGTLLLEPSPQLYTLRALSGGVTSRWIRLERGTTNTRLRFVNRFVDDLAKGTATVATGRDGLAVQAVIEAAYASAAAETPVVVEHFVARTPDRQSKRAVQAP